MSILDTFYLVFKGDTTHLKSGLSDARNKANSLNASLERTDVITEKTGRGLSKILKMALGLGAIVGSVRSVFEYSENLYSSSKALDVNIETLGAWSEAAKKAGGTSEGFQNSIKKMSEALSISPSQVFDKLPELADKFKNMSYSKSLEVGAEIGFDEKTIEFLRKGSKELSIIIAQQKELGVVTEKDAKIIHDFNLVWKDTTSSFKALGSVVLADLLPIVGALFSGLQQGMSTLSKYPNLVEGITYAIVALGTLLTALFVGPLLLSPIGLITTAVIGLGSAFALIYDDVKVFSEGGNSALGQLAEKFDFVNEAIGDTKDFLEDLIAVWDVLIGKSNQSLGSALSDFGKAPDKKSGFTGPSILNAEEEYERIRDSGGSFDEYDKKYFPKQLERQEAIENFFGRLGSDILDVLLFTTERSYGDEVTNSTSTNIQNLTINTNATDGEGIYRDFKSALDENRQAISTYDDGVAR